MTQFGISVEKNKELRRSMLRMKIFEKDIKESFVRSSGPGGQNVNKVSTCVCIHHLPTGIQIKSQQARTQGLNRYKARCRLMAKIEQKESEKQQRISKERHKKKRQNRKRSKRLKEKILEGKRLQSDKKRSRRKIKVHKIEDF